eukprot:663283-Pyramimonas_sp.AAC.1
MQRANSSDSGRKVPTRPRRLDRGGGGGRQCPLGRVALVLQAFHRARVLPHIGAAVLPLELLAHVGGERARSRHAKTVHFWM